jgi:hypothetical protein
VSKIFSLECREKEIKLEIEVIEDERVIEHVRSVMRAAEEQQKNIDCGLISTFGIAVESEKGLWKYKILLVQSDMTFENDNEDQNK